jgi:hypothetical protein
MLPSLLGLKLMWSPVHVFTSSFFSLLCGKSIMYHLPDSQLSKSWSKFCNAYTQQGAPSRGYCLENWEATCATIRRQCWKFWRLTKRIETFWENFVISPVGPFPPNSRSSGVLGVDHWRGNHSRLMSLNIYIFLSWIHQSCEKC